MKIVLLVLGLGFACGITACAGSPPAIQSTPETACRVEALQGRVVVRSSDGLTERIAKAGDPLQVGGELRVNKSGLAVLMLTENTLVLVQPETRLRLDALVPSPTGGFRVKWTLLGGRCLYQVQPVGPTHSSFEVNLGGLSATASGATFETALEGDQADLGVSSGELAVSGPGPGEKVEAGSHLAFQRGLLQLKRRLDRSEKERYEGWNSLKAEARENRVKRLRKIKKPKPKRAKRKTKHDMLPNPDSL